MGETALGLMFRNHYFVCVCVCEPVAMGYVRLEVQKSLLPVVGVNQLLWDMLGWRFRNHYFLLCVCEPVAMGKPCDAGLIVFSK